MKIEDKIKLVQLLLEDVAKAVDEEGRYRVEIKINSYALGEWTLNNEELVYWVPSGMRC